MLTLFVTVECSLHRPSDATLCDANVAAHSDVVEPRQAVCSRYIIVRAVDHIAQPRPRPVLLVARARRGDDVKLSAISLYRRVHPSTIVGARAVARYRAIIPGVYVQKAVGQSADVAVPNVRAAAVGDKAREQVGR